MGVLQAQVAQAVQKVVHKEKMKSNEIKYYLSFIGWGRSGNSLVAALLDFHPNIYIKNEFYPIQGKFKTQEQIFNKIFEKLERINSKGKSQLWGGFSHQKFKDMNNGIPLVIGGKKGGNTSNILLKNPELFKLIYDEVIKIPQKWIHVQRNPYDNITTFNKHGWEPDDAIDIYFWQAQAVEKVMEKRDCITVRLEDVIKNTKTEIKKLCNHLEVNVYDEYLDHCRNVTWSTPRQTRHNVDWWNTQRIESVKEKMKQYNFMDRYNYDN